MRRPGLEIVWAAIAGLVVLMLARTLLLYIFPPAPGINMADSDQIRGMAGALPIGVIVVLILSWLLAAAAGSAVAFLRGGRQESDAWLGAAPVGLFELWRGLALHYPLWMVLIGLLMIAGVAWGLGRLMGKSPG